MSHYMLLTTVVAWDASTGVDNQSAISLQFFICWVFSLAGLM